MRTCSKCGDEKADEAFRFHKDSRSGVKRLRSWCKKCEHRFRKRNSDPMYWRDKHLWRTYGIRLADFDRMLATQGGRCAICLTDEPGGKNWNVDHCHTTGKVRGILCDRCNRRLLTAAGDSPALLRRAADYLEAVSCPA